MKLAEYKHDNELSYRDLAAMLERPFRTVKYWCDRDYEVKVVGKRITKIKAPERVVWPS